MVKVFWRASFKCLEINDYPPYLSAIHTSIDLFLHIPLDIL